jgi:hypothetical protein
MSRIHVVKRNDDDSAPRVVGWFDSEDAQVFTEATSPQTVTSWGFGSRTEVRVPHRGVQGRTEVAPDSRGSLGDGVGVRAASGNGVSVRRRG